MANGTNGVTASEPATSWMSDVQRAIALILVGTFAILCILTTVRTVFMAEGTDVADMAKSLQSNLTNMGLIALGFFFGNTMAKMAQDAGQQKVVEKLTSPPPAGPVSAAPTPPVPTVVMAWWGQLTKEEQAKLETAAPTDVRVAAFVANSKLGKATPEDLAYLVGLGLLTAERAAVIQST